jgi:thiosulfate/3-mercaptopyruvate sulfurtransferase
LSSTREKEYSKWGDGLEQTMIAYSLARFGHKNIMILDGGLDKWKEEGKELTKSFPAVKESNFHTRIQHEYNVTMDEVKTLKESDGVLLLDARPTSLYEGFGPWALPGHIPGAINLPWRELMDDKNPALLKSDIDIQTILNQKNITNDKLIICSCGTGREATNEFLLFKWYLGYPHVKIYEGSFTEWVSHPENQTVTGKNPLLGQKEIVE